MSGDRNRGMRPMIEPFDLIGGDPAGLSAATSASAIRSVNPARPAEVVWEGRPDPGHLDAAIDAARVAGRVWARWEPQRRYTALERFAEVAGERAGELAAMIRRETGKAQWEAEAEASLIPAKVKVTLDRSAPDRNSGLARVRPYSIPMGETKSAEAFFRPHGVMAVLGPFNFPAHLPNGHIVPALAMGNTVVFKPSDKTPATGQLLAEMLSGALRESGAPGGVVNVVQGGADIAASLTAHPGVDGILFTGSWPVGRKILEANLDRPGRLVALEMGGNAPAVVMADADLRQAAIEIARGAFVTTGQRCTCTRRVIVHDSVADRLIGAIRKAAEAMVIADPEADPCFMGPLVSASSREAAHRFERSLAAGGGEVVLSGVERAGRLPRDLLESGGFYTGPAIVHVDRFVAEGADLSADRVDPGCDEEVFAPLLRVMRVRDLEGAIEAANATRYGLAAAIFTGSRDAMDRFRAECRAGCVNVNCATAGASGSLPFGGLGLSGNHRPAGAYSLDYCAYPVASMVERGGGAALGRGMSFDDSWIA